MIDKVYAEKLKKAAHNGVEIITRGTMIDTDGIKTGKPVPVELE